MERQRCGDERKASHEIKGNHAVPKYKNFMKNSGNKAALAAFISDQIMLSGHELLDDDQHIILAGGFADGHMVKVTKSDMSDLPDMFSSQEEADTRMVLHATNLASDFE